MTTLTPTWFRQRSPLFIATTVLGAALVTWIVTVQRMRGMDAGPGTDLGGLAWFLGVWVTMMAAMMLPSAAPMMLAFQRLSSERERHGLGFIPTWVFVAGYLAVWAVYGLVAYGLFRLVSQADFGFLAWDRGGPYVAGGAIALAGIYELTGVKSVCLRHCRSTVHFIVARWRPGRPGALLMGAEHGTYCVGCCAGLMLVLFALGVMSLLWMVMVGAVIFAQKVLPGGLRLRRVIAIALIAGGVWVAVAPSSVPGLTQPTGGQMPEMMS